jgi:hypothetical protein
MVQLKKRELAVSGSDVDNQGFTGNAALPAGLSLILTDAARSHLRAGDLDTAAACLEEAERLLSFLPGLKPV